MDEVLESLYNTNVTIIPNEFLEKFLADTNPEFIRVYVFYLWKGVKEKFSIKDTADYLNLTENDVERALKFLHKQKLILKSQLVKETGKIEVESKNTKKTEEQVDNNEEKKVDCEIKDDSLLFVVEKLLKQPMSERQTNLIYKCLNEYKWNDELVEYLVEYCVENEKTTTSYMDKVAMSWYEQGIKSKAEAKKFVADMSIRKDKKTKKVTPKKVDNERMDAYNATFVDSISNGMFM